MRYEHAGKFWTITHVGSVLTIISGKIGNKGRTVAKHFATEGAAASAHDELVLEKQREGYRIAGDTISRAKPVAQTPVDDDRGPALEAAIAADPDDATAYAVYGDWLQKHGDPRGELIALMQATGAKAVAAVGKHLAEHASPLLGSLTAYVPDVRKPEGPPFFWKHGFIRRATLESAKGRPVDFAVGQLFAHRSAQFLVELAVRADTRQEALGVLGALAGAPASLRDFELFARANLDRISWKHMPAVRGLDITARAFELAELEVPTLQRLRLRASNLSSATVAAVAVAQWPVLERLELRFSSRHGATESDFHDLRPFLVRSDMPVLTHLKLRDCPFAGAVARTLTASPLAAQLRVLDFSWGNFTPQDVEVFTKAHFPNLVELWMPVRAIDAKTQPKLAKLAKHLVPDSKGPLDTLDYDLAGETVPRGADRYEGIRE